MFLFQLSVQELEKEQERNLAQEQEKNLDQELDIVQEPDLYLAIVQH
jgi:hypothetical protein